MPGRGRFRLGSAAVSPPSQIVLTFLESVGRRQDAELYVRLFRQLPKASFALVALDTLVLREAMGQLVDALHFLSRLDLFPVLARGFEPNVAPDTDVIVEEFARELRHRRLDLVTRNGEAELVASAVRGDVEAGRIACVDFAANVGQRGVAALADLAVALQSRKLVLLRSRGGVGPKDARALQLSANHVLHTDENGINVVNLRTDLQPLLSGGYLDDQEQQLLRQVSLIHTQAPALVTSLTSPLNLLRELFTVRGAGTLIKTGSPLQQVRAYDDLQRERLVELLETTFGRTLRPEFLEQAPLAVYFEPNYRGAAIVHAGLYEGSAYLSKFAVIRSAQGEGLGRDLWEAVARDYPVLYWRARISNPISAWYRSQCDGMHRQGEWCVFWRGVPLERIPAFSRDALQRPPDLL